MIGWSSQTRPTRESEWLKSHVAIRQGSDESRLGRIGKKRGIEQIHDAKTTIIATARANWLTCVRRRHMARHRLGLTHTRTRDRFRAGSQYHHIPNSTV